jgi:hypothetical protein
MSAEPSKDAGPGSEIYARIARWALLRLREPRRTPTLHIVGYVVEHARLSGETGQPYIGSSLQELDIERRVAINRRGRRVALVGDPLPRGELPADIQAVIRRAEREWPVDVAAEWERLELSGVQAFGTLSTTELSGTTPIDPLHRPDAG